MCAIYSYYGEEDTERLLGFILAGSRSRRSFLVYACADWGAFSGAFGRSIKSLGEEFGEYTLIMYRYAKKYYKKCVSLKEKINSRSDKASS